MTRQVKVYILSIIGLILLSYLISNLLKDTHDISNESKTTGLNSKFDSLVWFDEFDGNGVINQEK